MSVITRKRTSSKGTLVLRIKPGDSILIDDSIEIILAEIESRNRLKMVIVSPQSTRVRRREFEERNKTKRENTEKAKGNS